LAQKAQEVGYHPEIILAGRRVNDSMGKYVAAEIVKLMVNKDIRIKNAKVLALGITFKENCPDVRNTKAVDVINELIGYGTDVTIYDPWADSEEVVHEYGLQTTKELPKDSFDTVVLNVSHKEFETLDIKKLLNPKGVIYDVKGVAKEYDGRL
jgi:UDP-N-acetyl-D-galactosamine dehydrogenase